MTTTPREVYAIWVSPWRLREFLRLRLMARQEKQGGIELCSIPPCFSYFGVAGRLTQVLRSGTVTFEKVTSKLLHSMRGISRYNLTTCELDLAIWLWPWPLACGAFHVLTSPRGIVFMPLSTRRPQPM